MAFDSFTAFIEMGGHGPFVWSCYALFFVSLAVMVWWSLRQRRQLQARLRRQWQLESRRTGSGNSQVEGPASADFTPFNPS